jgi:hypothetical protein
MYCFFNRIISKECLIVGESHKDCLVLGVYLFGQFEGPHFLILTWTPRHVLRDKLLLKVWWFL